ncbi:hypothetical protein CTI12_AA251790 [Artemisia annua]|uniref:Uncharacterized protein n=1 Tax=Artemisia annua TaxID=35608 RepID=A0A2U1NCG7_ARTAN|nr:hypothetical protein CTI12_AA251790 [Artemisia annua]
MQVIVKEDGQHNSKTVLFPRLKSLTLTDLPNVEGFFLGMNEFLWSILDEVKIYGCPKMMTFTSGRSMTPKLLYIHTGIGKHSLECGLNFPLSNASHENLEKLHIRRENRQLFFKEVKEIFEVVDLENDDVNEKQSVVVFPKLKEVTLEALDSMSLLLLHELEISCCRNMEVIVKKAEDSDTTATDVVVFRSLKSIKLGHLPNLKGFCLGMEDFLWQSLDTLEIKDCPQITVFTCGQSTTPQLKVKATSTKKHAAPTARTKKVESFFGDSSEEDSSSMKKSPRRKRLRVYIRVKSIIALIAVKTKSAIAAKSTNGSSFTNLYEKKF